MAKDKKSTINVQGTAISILSQREEDFISLTDISKKFGDGSLINSCMRHRNTVEFLGIWEQIKNPNFKGDEFETFAKTQRQRDPVITEFVGQFDAALGACG